MPKEAVKLTAETRKKKKKKLLCLLCNVRLHGFLYRYFFGLGRYYIGTLKA